MPGEGPKHGVGEFSSCAYNRDDFVSVLQLAKAGGWELSPHGDRAGGGEGAVQETTTPQSSA